MGKRKITLIGMLCVLMLGNAIAQKKITRKEYIDTYSELAMKEMQRVGIPASITLAQGILESGDGNSKLAKKGKNHFGIKCHGEWEGKKMYHDDDKKGECFRVYSDAYESYVDHSEFLVNKQRYAFLFELKADDYKGWAKGLKKAGYATNPKYPKLLIELIEDNKLYEYDEMVLKGKFKPNESDRIASRKTDEVSDNSVEEESELPPILADIDKFDISAPGRDIKKNNNCNYIIVKKGDTFYSIAKEFDLMVWQLYAFNDIEKDEVLKAGSILYLQHKKSNSHRKYKTHKVKKGETLQYISQIYAVRMKRLMKLNALITNEVDEGVLLKLRK